MKTETTEGNDNEDIGSYGRNSGRGNRRENYYKFKRQDSGSKLEELKERKNSREAARNNNVSVPRPESRYDKLPARGMGRNNFRH